MDDAKLIARQTTVRPANGGCVTDEATNRDIELLRHCERDAGEFGVTLAAAIGVMCVLLSPMRMVDGVSPRMVTFILNRPEFRGFAHGEALGIRVCGRGPSCDAWTLRRNHFHLLMEKPVLGDSPD